MFEEPFPLLVLLLVCALLIIDNFFISFYSRLLHCNVRFWKSCGFFWQRSLILKYLEISRFDAIKERISFGHNQYFVVPFGGKTTRFRGPWVITVYPAVPFGSKIAG
ncbi:hypothetical protein MA16_Dca009133 [Dendrobium catenatum]|uniref:Uncharacterized protein n=1 Tax=Dendrobium catenatum TaxID=906689 RepID=A0A2I0VQW7_9ASPA|nr:hypothetical protein MA16_Dca009133 [Dendrobium catenatum]